MAPHLISRRGDGSGSSSPLLSQSPWLLVAVILSALVIAMLVVFIILYFMRKRRTARENQPQRFPVMSNNPLQPTPRRRRNMSAADRMQAEELERSLMIRKSLASRSTFSSIASRDSQVLHSARSSSILNHNPFETPEEREDREDNLEAADDWKEWEARAQVERRHSRLGELVAGGMAQHPALARELQDLPIPRQVRVSSPSRQVRAPHESLPLPSLPSPPPSPPHKSVSERTAAIRRDW